MWSFRVLHLGADAGCNVSFKEHRPTPPAGYPSEANVGSVT